MARTQGERKFVRKQKYSLPEKKVLGELDKNVTLLLVYSDSTTRLIHFAVFSTSSPRSLRSTVNSGPKIMYVQSTPCDKGVLISYSI